MCCMTEAEALACFQQVRVLLKGLDKGTCGAGRHGVGHGMMTWPCGQNYDVISALLSSPLSLHACMGCSRHTQAHGKEAAGSPVSNTSQEAMKLAQECVKPRSRQPFGLLVSLQDIICML